MSAPGTTTVTWDGTPTLTWEQKLAALNALSECELHMRAPGNWYASQPGVGITNGHIERGGGGNGRNPEEAALALWEYRVGELTDDEAVYVRSRQRYVRWNGFMWVDVERPS